MKAFNLFVCLLGAGMLCASCSDDDDNKVKTQTVTFEGTYWNSLIDSPQYNGPLLYGNAASTYHWIDDNTQLRGGMSNSWGGQYGFSEGGIAISNYVSNDLKNHNSFEYQLEVPGSNGSKNFAIVYCNAKMEFNDGQSHVIRSMQICPTTYVLSIAQYGNDFAKALTGEDDFLTIHIEADNGATMDVDLVRNGKPQTTWKQISLQNMGAVKSLSFSMSGSDSNDWGLTTPAYFALDNVVIEK